jgi:hypothetical protein
MGHRLQEPNRLNSLLLPINDLWPDFCAKQEEEGCGAADLMREYFGVLCKGNACDLVQGDFG